jgi:hypothetical protein
MVLLLRPDREHDGAREAGTMIAEADEQGCCNGQTVPCVATSRDPVGRCVNLPPPGGPHKEVLAMQETDETRERDDQVRDGGKLGGREISGSGMPDALVGGAGATTGQSEFTTGADTHGGTDMGGDDPPGGGPADQGGRTSEPGLDDEERTTSDAGG